MVDCNSVIRMTRSDTALRAVSETQQRRRAGRRWREGTPGPVVSGARCAVKNEIGPGRESAAGGGAGGGFGFGELSVVAVAVGPAVHQQMNAVAVGRIEHGVDLSMGFAQVRAA